MRKLYKSKPYAVLASIPVILWPLAVHAQTLTGFDGETPSAKAEEQSIQAASLTGFDDEAPAASSAEESALTGQAPPKSKQENAGSSEALQPSDEPVALDAEHMERSEDTVTASGNVFLEQAGRILRADKIVYNLKTDQAVASGHVVLNEENGDIHYADNVKLNDKLKNGFVTGVKVYLADGSRLTAEKGRRENGTKTIMKNATYTPCEPCKEHPERPPEWGIRASEVIHDEATHTVQYKNARFEAGGVPIMYLPYFSNADGSVKQKSGFIAPTAGYKSSLGAFVGSSYYYGIAPNRDATIGMVAFSKQDPLLSGQWRQRWDDALLVADGSVTYSSRVASENGIDIDKNDKLRGNLFAKGLWDMTDTWRTGLDIDWASDDQYLRQYSHIDATRNPDRSNDILENQIYAERFSGRDYAVGRILAFQDIRILSQREEQPMILPEITAEFTGEPGSVPILGGRWNYSTSLLGLQREGSEQAVDRLSFNGGWQRRLVSDYGLLTTVEASLREDLYDTRNSDDAVVGSDDSAVAGRFFPQMNIKTSYPLEKQMEKMQATIEPIVEITLAPNIDVNSKIPNEDSQDVEIDSSNIFEPNRFPGYDRVEDQSHVTYGVRTGLYGYEGSRGEAFLGQSHRLQNDDNPFPAGSGLDRQNSDIVGEISGRYGKTYDLTYRFQLASDSLAAERHEVTLGANWNKFNISTHYLFADSLDGTNIDESREQVQTSAGYYFNKKWHARVGATEDLGSDPGLRRANIGLDFFGQCISWSLVAERNLVDDATGESSSEVLFNLGLKNLGTYKPSGLRDEDNED